VEHLKIYIEFNVTMSKRANLWRRIFQTLQSCVQSHQRRRISCCAK